MGKCHVISAKRMGWEQMYDYYTFSVKEYSEEEALAQFRPVQKEADKNGRNYPFTAFQYDGTFYYSVVYSGIADEKEFE